MCRFPEHILNYPGGEIVENMRRALNINYQKDI